MVKAVEQAQSRFAEMAQSPNYILSITTTKIPTHTDDKDIRKSKDSNAGQTILAYLHKLTTRKFLKVRIPMPANQFSQLQNACC
ncbi:hypothetical protein GJ496_011004 [Pomphorhynchus laevis]|nr:hypothetical protein GJ496_011004 [Pomphorhynchus laevis]